MRKLLLLLGALFFLVQMGNAQKVCISDSTLLFNRQSLNLVDAFMLNEGACMSVATNGNHFYFGRWLSNHIFQYNMDGSYVDVFTISGVSELREMTSDGEYFYGVNASMNIYKMDLVNRTLVSIIPVTCSGLTELRHIAYDPALNGNAGGFWLGGWTDIGTVAMNGSQLTASISLQNAIVYGSTYDPYSDPENPCLWFMTQINDGFAIIRQFDIKTLSLTSFSQNCGNDYPPCYGSGGGGLFGYVDDGKFRLAADIQYSPNIILIYDVADLTPDGAPKAVTDLKVTPNASGNLEAVISWTNPNQTYDGATLTQLTAVKIYEENTLIHTVSNPPIGGTSSYTVSVSNSGYYKYKVLPENSAGTGPSASVTSPWIGHDLPAAPGNPVCVGNSETWVANVSWTAPTTGINGGYFSAANLVYDVYRMPNNVLVSSEQATTTFTETITAPGTYYYKITAKNHVGTGESSNTNELMFCSEVTTFPWQENFSSTTFPPTCWSRFRFQGTSDWEQTNGIIYSSPYSASHNHAYGNNDTWLVTPAIELPAEGNYSLVFLSCLISTGNYGSSEVWISTQSNNPASGFEMVKRFVSEVDFTTNSPTNEWRKFRIDLNDYQGQTIYIGFRYYSDLNEYAHAWYIDDLTIRDMPDMEMEAKRVYGSVTPMVGQPFLYKAAVESTGRLPLAGYTVKLKDGNGNVLASNNTGTPIAWGKTALIDLHWIPETAGALSLYAEVELPEAPNDISPAFQTTIQPAAQQFNGKIGNENYASPFLPFAFFNVYSTAQSIYFGHEIINRSGVIEQLQFFNNFTLDLNTPIQILMTNTIQNELDEWIPESEFLTVFQGGITFPAGQQTITIDLDEPFVYTGDNLVIMTKPVGGVSQWPGSRQFFSTETPDFINRSRFYNHNYVELDMSVSPGMGANYHANVVLKITLSEDVGSVSGTITSDGTTPVEGALVEILGSTQNKVTDENGEYRFDYLVPGSYRFKVSKYGYNDATSDPIDVEANENAVVNITILPLSTFTVSGKVIGNDISGGLENVTITLTGYEEYTGKTNATGDYSIPNVFGEHTYTVTATLKGYQTYTATIEVNNDIIHDITLVEIAYPVVGLKAEIVDADAVISWREPDGSMPKIFRYDSGINAGQVGWWNPPGTRNSIIGALHNVSAELHSMSWYSTAEWVQNAYDLWILGLNGNGKPDRNNVIFTAQNINNIPLQWCSYEFPAPIDVPDGFFMGVSPSNGGFTSIGTASSTTEYPFIPDVNLFSMDDQEEFTCFSADGFSVNAMIRAEGYAAEKTARLRDNHAKYLTNYRIYRLLEGQQGNEASWIELAANLSEATYTDETWSSLSPGVYRYAVKAQYSGEILSIAGFTRQMPKDMEFPYTVNLSTNTGEPVAGAEVILKNIDDNPNHLYTEIAKNGIVDFANVWRGTYSITVTLEGFHPYSAQNITIDKDGLSHDVLLEEKISTPYGLSIEKTDNDGERLFLWNRTYPKSYILDDGTAEDGYFINPGWNMSLGNKFEVNEEGFITSVDIYGLNNPLADIFGHNSVTVDIYDQNRNLTGQSSPFYLADDNWGNVPLNNIPYSGTFYAMIHWYPDGSGYTNAVGVDTAGSNSNAELDMILYNGQWGIAHYEFQDVPFVFMIRINAETTGAAKSTTYDKHNASGIINGNFEKIASRIKIPETVDAEAKYVTPEQKTDNSKSLLGFTVYLNDVEIANNLLETQFLFSGLENGTYKAGVKSVYMSGESEIVYTIPFVVEVGIETYGSDNTVLYPNPFTNEIYISNPESVKSIEIRNIVGQKIKEFALQGKSIPTKELLNGVYFITLENFTGERSVYKMIK